MTPEVLEKTKRAQRETREWIDKESSQSRSWLEISIEEKDGRAYGTVTQKTIIKGGEFADEHHALVALAVITKDAAQSAAIIGAWISATKGAFA